MSSPTSQIAKRPKPSNFTDAEVELGLQALAIASGNSRRAERALRDHGLRVDQKTLRNWRQRHEERYSQIQEELMPTIRRRLAENSEDIVQRMGDLETKIASSLERKVKDLEPRDLAGALRNVSTTKGINSEKALLWRGQPTSISAHADVTDLLKSLSQRYGDVVGTASAVADPALPPTNAQASTPPASSSDRHQDPNQSA